MRTLFRKLWRFLRLAAIAAIIVGVVRTVMGKKKPEVTGEASWPPLVDDARTSAPSALQADVAGTPEQDDAQAEDEPELSTDGESSETDSSEVVWVDPADGECPASHPVKGNAQSKIYHVPGGASYGRTVAERCYISAEAAEADGFRAAKR